MSFDWSVFPHGDWWILKRRYLWLVPFDPSVYSRSSKKFGAIWSVCFPAWWLVNSKRRYLWLVHFDPSVYSRSSKKFGVIWSVCFPAWWLVNSKTTPSVIGVFRSFGILKVINEMVQQNVAVSFCYYTFAFMNILNRQLEWCHLRWRLRCRLPMETPYTTAISSHERDLQIAKEVGDKAG